MQDYLDLSDNDFDDLEGLPTELDSWLNKDYLNQIATEIVNLNDYVPNMIELLLPNPGARDRFVQANVDLRDSEYFIEKQILDQTTIWKDYVNLYDDFFEKHPEFSNLINNREDYEKWKLEGHFEDFV